MNILAQEKNYLPIDIETKYHACSRRVVSSWSIKKSYRFIMLKEVHFIDGLRNLMVQKNR